MRPVRKPWWQQATALVTVSTGGVISGFNFVPGAAATMTSPTSVPVHLLALEQAAQAGVPGGLAVSGDSASPATSDAQLRTAIVNVAGYYLRLAQSKTPAQMEALIWGDTSSDGADHGPSCAAFASLTLELAAQTVGLQSWVTGGDTYPWPMPEWADVRVQTNPDSPEITSMVAAAQDHDRWHARGDGYQPQPGDWAIYEGHVEVVTSYAGGVLDTIGADSLPGLTVNAHSSGAPLAAQGVLGFVDNGNLGPAAGSHAALTPTGAAAERAAEPSGAPAAPAGGTPNVKASPSARPAAAQPGVKQAHAAHPATPAQAAKSAAAVPGLPGADRLSGSGGIPGAGGSAGDGRQAKAQATAAIPGLSAASAAPATLDAPGTAVIPGAGATAASAPPANAKAAPAPKAQPAQPAKSGSAKSGSAKSGSAQPANAKPAPAAKPQYATPATRDQQAFISLVAPGAVAAQQRYGVPAAVTIAQAIEESAWGQSSLAAEHHNLFGIKGTGPAGSVTLPTAEHEGGKWVTVHAQFRAYHNDAESIADHAELLATSGYYTRAMADRAVPDAFANDLTGVYATDPHYGANLIALMKLYNLYQYDAGSGTGATPAVTSAPPAAVSAAPSTLPSAPSATAGGHTAGAPGTSAPAQATAPAAPSSGGGQIPGLVSPHAFPWDAAPGQVTPGTGNTDTGSTGTGSTGTRGGGSAADKGPAARPASGAIPGLVTPRTSPSAAAARTYSASQSTGHSTGSAGSRTGQGTRARAASPVTNVVTTAYVSHANAGTGHVTPARATARRPAASPAWYEPAMPNAVTTAIFASAKGPLGRGEHLYRDVAAGAGVSWKLLAAVDWMQCKADPRYSPVAGEKLGSLNDDGTSYSTKSAALTQCARDLAAVAAAVYGIDLTARRPLSVRELAAAFAAFRWGGILRQHGVSPMEFPYSVAGLTAAHQKMHWPSIDAPDAPDRLGSRFRAPFGAVPVLLSLGYPATV